MPEKNNKDTESIDERFLKSKIETLERDIKFWMRVGQSYKKKADSIEEKETEQIKKIQNLRQELKDAREKLDKCQARKRGKQSSIKF